MPAQRTFRLVDPRCHPVAEDEVEGQRSTACDVGMSVAVSENTAARRGVGQNELDTRAQASEGEVSAHARKRRSSIFQSIGRLRSFKEVTTEYSEVNNFTIDPDATWKQAWDWWIIVLVLYNTVLIPLELGFTSHFDGPDVADLAKWDIFVDCLFGVDILFSFSTQLRDRRGDTIMDRRLIARTYMKYWFWIDAVAVIPFEVLFLTISGKSGGQSAGAIAMLKTVRLFRLGRLFKKLDKFSAANFLRIIKLMLMYIMVCHWFACIWFWLAEEYEAEDPNIAPYRWTVHAGIEDASLKTQYGYSLHWALTAVLPGSGTVLPRTDEERAYADLVFISGALMNAFVFGNVAALIQSFDAIQGQYTKRVENLRAFAMHYEIPPELRARVLSYVENAWMVDGGFNVKQVCSDLPVHIQYDICDNVYRQITEAPIFSNCEHAFVRMVLERLTQMVCMPREILVGIEDPVLEMFFLMKGVCGVVNSSGDVLTILNPGKAIGHVALLREQTRRSASVIAVKLCELARLSKADFEVCIRAFPDHKAILVEFADKEAETHANQNSMMEGRASRDAHMSECASSCDYESESEIFDNVRPKLSKELHAPNAKQVKKSLPMPTRSKANDSANLMLARRMSREVMSDYYSNAKNMRWRNSEPGRVAGESTWNSGFEKRTDNMADMPLTVEDVPLANAGTRHAAASRGSTPNATPTKAPRESWQTRSDPAGPIDDAAVDTKANTSVQARLTAIESKLDMIFEYMQNLELRKSPSFVRVMDEPRLSTPELGMQRASAPADMGEGDTPS